MTAKMQRKLKAQRTVQKSVVPKGQTQLVTIAWEPPVDCDEVDKYEVTITDGGKPSTILTDETSIDTPLSKGVTYDIGVVAIYKGNRSRCVTTQLTVGGVGPITDLMAYSKIDDGLKTGVLPHLPGDKAADPNMAREEKDVTDEDDDEDRPSFEEGLEALQKIQKGG